MGSNKEGFIFATGSSGTIGRHLPPEVLPLIVNLGEKDFQRRLPNWGESDSLIHLAGVVGTSTVEKNPNLAFDINVNATVKLAENFLNQTEGRFIYVSSSHVYMKSDQPMSETSPLLPVSKYAQQKRAAELELERIFEYNRERLCIVRVFSVLDWNVPSFSLGGAVAKMINSKVGFKLECGDDIRDFLTPSSVCSALVEIAKKSSMHGVYNLCSGEGISIASAANKMLEAAGYPELRSQILKGISDNPYLVGFNNKLKNELPHLNLTWTPSTYTLEW